MGAKRSVPFALALFAVLCLGTPAVAQERFDYQVREDLFRGFAGSEASFTRALSLIDEALRANPNHAEALAWRGAARYWKAGQAFGAGDAAGGRALAADAMADLDRALALAPRNVGVLAPRAAVLLAAAREQRDPARMQDLARLAAADFETAVAIRDPAFATFGQHNRGEYLAGLAESWALAGNRDMAESYLRRILTDMPDSAYAKRAGAKLADWSDRQPMNCQTCH